MIGKMTYPPLLLIPSHVNVHKYSFIDGGIEGRIVLKLWAEVVLSEIYHKRVLILEQLSFSFWESIAFLLLFLMNSFILLLVIIFYLELSFKRQRQFLIGGISISINISISFQFQHVSQPFYLFLQLCILGQCFPQHGCHIREDFLNIFLMLLKGCAQRGIVLLDSSFEAPRMIKVWVVIQMIIGDVFIRYDPLLIHYFNDRQCQTLSDSGGIDFYIDAQTKFNLIDLRFRHRHTYNNQGMNLQYPLNDNYHAYKHLEIIKCKQNKILLISWNSCETEFSVIIIHKIKVSEQLRPLREIIDEMGPFQNYEQAKRQIQSKLGQIHEKQSIYALGIVGFHCFLQGYYMMYIKESQAVAKIGRHKIYEIKATAILPLFQLRSDNTKKNQQKYSQILHGYKLQNYYYSYTYDMTNTLAKNMVRNAKPFFGIQGEKVKNKPNIYSQFHDFQGICQVFQFNRRILQQFHAKLSIKKWIIAIVHGYCKHINVKLKGTFFNIIVIARRSRHHAGTRYIKRGIGPSGFAANYVEVEQIVINYSSSQDTRPVCSSFVQVRGSVPTYWMQKPSLATPKPAIQIRPDDYLFLGTRKHFHDMIARYGKLIYCINLMKMKEKTPRQSLLSKQYSNAISFINKHDIPQESALHYAQIDMKYNLKLDKKLFITKIRTISYYTILKTGIFLCMNHSTSSHEQYIQFQNGVIRANCVDCLDRTNSLQQLVGQTILAVQLNRLIGEDVKIESLELDQSIISMYGQLYEEMGDLISIQYGSSLAHKQKIQKSTESRFQFFTSLQRHYNNNVKDKDRQDQIDIFLGYRPDPSGTQLWDCKPPIQHYPSMFVNRFENYNWFQVAYKYFLEDYCIPSFQALSRQNPTDVNLPKLQKLGKQYLINKFNAQIVSSLVNQKEQSCLYGFFVMPKLILEKRVWKQMNPRSKQVKSLQQQLSLSYNKMDFLKNTQQTHMPPIKLKQSSSQLKQSKRGPKRNLNPDDDLQFLSSVASYANLQLMDQEQIELITKYLKGDIVPDSQIEKEVLEMLEGGDQPTSQFINERMVTQQMKRIENGLQKGNYIEGVEEETGKQKEGERIKVVEVKKREVVRQNKVEMLKQIMTKNFSHGQITNITEV